MILGNMGEAPREGRDGKKNIDANIAVRRSMYRRGGIDIDMETPNAEKDAAEFSVMNHIFTMNELEFGIIVMILLFFVCTLLWQMYTGRYQVPVFLRFIFKRPGSRYNN